MSASTMSHRNTGQERIDDCVEGLCNQGCKAVWGQIAALERGESIAGTEALAPHEVALVLKELRAVMACYEGSCTTD